MGACMMLICRLYGQAQPNNGRQRTRNKQVFYPQSPARAADAWRYAAPIKRCMK